MTIKTIGRPKGYQYPVGLSKGSSPGNNVAITTSGGNQIVENDNVFHIFTTSNTFIPQFDGELDVLVVAGGGGGMFSPPGNGGQAGGGAGGVVLISGQPISYRTSYTITIGAGGSQDTRGANSSFGTNLIGWGGGGSSASPTSPSAGGSSAGLYGNANTGILQKNNPSLPADSRTYGYGNYGGAAAGGGPGSGFGGGGGGGAGGAGSNGISPVGAVTGANCNGGIGLTTTNISWLVPLTIFAPTSNSFAGGGGGSSRSGGGFGQSGGGNGVNAIGFPGVAAGLGVANRGGGGGGGSPTAGSGGSGIVIVRYSKTNGYSIN